MDRGNYRKFSKINKNLSPCFFKDEGSQWKIILYQDDLQSPFNPNGVLIKTMKADPGTILEIPLAAGGGFAIKLEKQ
ncbi:MAG: glycoside hydrolase family 97 C-terminal domain-containing protein [Puia sp.]